MQTLDGTVAIRPFVLGDIPKLYDAVLESMGVISPWLSWCKPDYSIADTQSWVTSQCGAFSRGDEYSFAVVDSRDQLLGGCALNRVDVANKYANLGYWTRSAQVGRGVATQGVRLLVEWAFSRTDLQHLAIIVSVENQASRRIAEKAGARFVCDIPKRVCLQGRMHDASMFVFTR